MNEITHILFDMHHTLIDSNKLAGIYAQGLGQLMSARYGLTPEDWAAANRKILADFDSYYADLDLGADDGLKQAWEGVFRQTRALFRLTGVPEPAFDELWALTRLIPGHAPRGGNSLYPDSAPTIHALHQRGYILGIATHAFTAQAIGTLTGSGIIHYFDADSIIGMDSVGTVFKEPDYLREALRIIGVSAHNTLLIDDKAWIIANAHAIGMHGIRIDRQQNQNSAETISTLSALLERL